MKKLLVIPVVLLFAGFYSYYTYTKSINDVLSQLKLSDEQAKDMIWSDLSGAYFYFPNPGQLKNAAAGEKAQIVQSVAEYAKAYTKSEEFKAKYAELRENRKPQEPDKPKLSDQMKAEYKETLEKSIAESEENKKKMTAEQAVYIDQAITMYKQQLAELDNNPMFSKDMDNLYMQQYNMQLEDYNQKVKEWEQTYSDANSDALIKTWLQKFLDETKDIDFSAEVQKNQRGKVVFVKSGYESKSSLWKLCYRTGKEATEAARTYAQQWIAELK